MKIGADRWLNISKMFDSEAKRDKAIETHKAQRVRNGMSWYDWINADEYICGVIAQAARKFAMEGSGYPGYMTEEEWREQLALIYLPLENYVRHKHTMARDEEEKLHEEVSEALHAFADYFGHFWD